MAKEKSRYTALPGVMHGGEKSPIKMVNAASTTAMNTVNQPLATGPLMKGAAGLMGKMAGQQPSMIELEKKYNPGKYRGGQAGEPAE